MFIKQIYTSCLAEAAYYIESNGEAAIIDPLREVEPYLDLAIERNSKIKYIFETHFHADFISGHLDLAEKTGARIVYGPKAKADFKFHEAHDKEQFKIGSITLELLHTPGHTEESSCLLLKDETEKDYAIFTGDTLFVGDVGRPDLAVKSNLTQKDLARLLYDSLHEKIMPLDDHIIIYPAHGAGSSCGKNIGQETFSTIGEQKKMNYALQAMSQDAFIDVVTSGLSAPPKYFFDNARINKSGYSSLDSVLEKNRHALNLQEFKDVISEDILILDTREADHFETNHIPGSINIGRNGMLAIWAGSLLDLNRRIVIVAENDLMADESILRLARVGIENIVGYLSGGFATWKNSNSITGKINTIEPDDLNQNLNNDAIILDVRRETEYARSHVESAINIPLDSLEEKAADLDSNQSYFIYCARGYRSMIASSMLTKHGFSKITNIRGGFVALERSKVTIH